MVASDGLAGLDFHHLLSPDLVILDVKLPKRDGVDVLLELRRRGNTPVIMSTALGEDLEKLTALKIGADDYLVKPFNPLELVARAKAVLRRSASSEPRGTVVRIAGLEIDTSAHQVRVCSGGASGGSVDVTATEFRILSHMSRAPRKVFSRAEILDACLPPDGNAMERTVDSHVSKLRLKLEACGATGILEVVRGVGYRLTSP